MSKSLFKKLITAFFVAGLAVVGWSSLSSTVHACKGEGKHAAGHSCPLKMEGTSVAVENVDDGVRLVVTSKDKATVQRLQAWGQRLASGEGCGGKGHSCDGKSCKHGAK